MNLLKKTIRLIQAVSAVLLLILTTILGFIPIFFIGLLKLIPHEQWQNRCTQAIDVVATAWCGINSYYVHQIQKMQLHVTGLECLDRKSWYLVVSNHQSWLDIVILQSIFNRKIPVLKFFIKDQLKWIPFLGFCWWAMGCPFMKRYSKEYLVKNPHKQGKDLIATRNAVNAFKRTPASVMNFIEGTRFTPSKKRAQNSPYTHLLKPKAGGISFVISSMSEQITSLLDVTIVYAEKQHSLWDFLCKRVRSATVLIRTIPIPAQFISPQLVEDHEMHNEFKAWLNQQWAEKDHLISSLGSHQ